MKRFLAILLLSGCAGRDPAADLDVRLVAKGPFAVGKPAVFTLEATNRGSVELCFDVQGLLHGPYEIHSSAGPDAPSKGLGSPGLGTVQRFVSVKPGETLTLDEFDAADHFVIAGPGAYVARFRGLEIWGRGEPEWVHEGPEGSVLIRLPASPPLPFTVAPGTLSPLDQALRSLVAARPEGWTVYKSGPDELTFLEERRGARVRVFLSENKDATRAGDFWVSTLRVFSKNPAAAAAEPELRKTLLPGLIRAIEKAGR
jgi:hypothetical protein